MNPVLESIQPIIKQARHVRIDQERLETLARNLEQTSRIGSHWTASCPVDISALDTDQKLGFLFVFNAISFSYWGEPSWQVEYQGRTLTRGTWSMIAALHRAVEERVPVLDPAYLAEIKDEQLEQMLRGNTTIPLLREKAVILSELGSTIQERYHGNFSEVVEGAEGDAVQLVDLLVDEFPSFNDTAEYRGHKVQFHKRAQLLASDISQLRRYPLRNIDQLTACADYILPMVLRYHGVLRYSPELSTKVDKGIELPKGSAEEVEIRAHTLAAVETMKRSLGNQFTAMQINDALWLAGDRIPTTERYHRTRTTAY